MSGIQRHQVVTHHTMSDIQQNLSGSVPLLVTRIPFHSSDKVIDRHSRRPGSIKRVKAADSSLGFCFLFLIFLLSFSPPSICFHFQFPSIFLSSYSLVLSSPLSILSALVLCGGTGSEFSTLGFQVFASLRILHWKCVEQKEHQTVTEIQFRKSNQGQAPLMMAKKEEPFLTREPDLVYSKNRTSNSSECLAIHQHHMKRDVVC